MPLRFDLIKKQLILSWSRMCCMFIFCFIGYFLTFFCLPCASLWMKNLGLLLIQMPLLICCSHWQVKALNKWLCCRIFGVFVPQMPCSLYLDFLMFTVMITWQRYCIQCIMRWIMYRYQVAILTSLNTGLMHPSVCSVWVPTLKTKRCRKTKIGVNISCRGRKE